MAISITPEIPAIVGESRDICITSPIGLEVTYSIDYGDDSTVDTEYKETQDANPTCFQHAYDEGSFTIAVNLTNLASQEFVTTTIIAQNPIENIYVIFEPVAETGSNYDVTVDLNSDSPLPTNVSCDVTFESDPVTIILTGIVKVLNLLFHITIIAIFI